VVKLQDVDAQKPGEFFGVKPPKNAAKNHPNVIAL